MDPELVPSVPNRLSRLFDQHPLLSCVGILVLAEFVWWFGVGVTTDALAHAMPVLDFNVRGHAAGLAASIATTIWSGVVLLAAWRVLAGRGWARLVGFNGRSRWREPWLGWVLVLYVLLNLSSLLGKTLRAPDWQPLVQAIVSAPSGALFEESVFRGLILAVLLSRFHKTRAEVVTSVLFSSLLFGIAHAGTLLSPDFPRPTAVANIVYAAFAGVGFAAIVLRTRNIWLVAAIHAAIAFANWLPVLLTRGYVAAGVALIAKREQAMVSAIVTTLACLPLFLYGLWLLRDISKLDLTFTSIRQSATRSV